MPFVPKKLHAVWLGDILKDEGKKNIADWAYKNPDYEANIWIDSSTFLTGDSKEAITQKKAYLEFKTWAKAHNIWINDINPLSNDPDPRVRHQSALFNHMENKANYQNELINPGSNYAAASDILRVEILYHLGGVYIDADDLHTGLYPLGSLDVSDQAGILLHVCGNKLNNDLIASIPKGKVISTYRDAIKNNYQIHYQRDQKYQDAHRFSHLASFRMEQDNRLNSTLKISGPIALINALNGELHEEMIFPQDRYSMPPEQALSWLDKTVTYPQFKEHFRLNMIDYFNSLIESYPIQDEPIRQFQSILNADCRPESLLHVLATLKNAFTEEEVSQLNQSTGNLFQHMENLAKDGERFLRYCELGAVKIDELWDYFQSRCACYKENLSFSENLSNHDGIHYFFRHQLSDLGFFEIMKLKKVQSADYPKPWCYAFSRSKKLELINQVEAEMEMLEQGLFAAENYRMGL